VNLASVLNILHTMFAGRDLSKNSIANILPEGLRGLTSLKYLWVTSYLLWEKQLIEWNKVYMFSCTNFLICLCWVSRMLDNNVITSLPSTVFWEVPMTISAISLWGNSLSCYPLPANKDVVAIEDTIPFCISEVRATVVMYTLTFFVA
jgi:hypothetical protein